MAEPFNISNISGEDHFLFKISIVGTISYIKNQWWGPFNISQINGWDRFVFQIAIVGIISYLKINCSYLGWGLVHISTISGTDYFFLQISSVHISTVNGRDYFFLQISNVEITLCQKIKIKKKQLTVGDYFLPPMPIILTNSRS